MAKIVVECSNPNDLNEVEAIMDQVAGRCNITYFKQHQGMVDAGVSESQRESARKIAEGTGETPEAVRSRIRRGEKEVGRVEPENSEVEKESGGVGQENSEEEKDPWPLCSECGTSKVKPNPGSKKPLAHGMCNICRIKHNQIQKGIDPEAERYWELVAVRIARFRRSLQRNYKSQTNISDKCRENVVEALEYFVANLKYFEKDMTYGWKE
jgi:hypothetical protein